MTETELTNNRASQEPSDYHREYLSNRNEFWQFAAEKQLAINYLLRSAEDILPASIFRNEAAQSRFNELYQRYVALMDQIDVNTRNLEQYVTELSDLYTDLADFIYSGRSRIIGTKNKNLFNQLNQTFVGNQTAT